jgi:hypothetical protein
MQVRAATGAETSAIVARPIAGFGTDVPAFLRLVVTPEGPRTTVQAETSADGVAWRTIGTATLQSELPVRGLAVSSHEPRTARAVFAGVTRAKLGGTPSPVTAAALPLGTSIGLGASGEAFEGVFP